MPLPRNQTLAERLPNEILRILFSIVADNDLPNYSMPHVQDSWIRLAHVCARWRRILLDMPALWARDVLAFGLGRAHEDMLVRTKNHPLDLAVNTLDRGAVKKLIHLIPHAKVLICVIRPLGHEQMLEPLTTLTLPLLQRLSINGETHCDLYRDKSLAGLRNLQSLRLKNIYLRPPLSGSLVSLDIDLGLRQSTTGPSIDSFVQVLIHNPALNTLRINHAFQDRNTAFTRYKLALSELRLLEATFPVATSAPVIFNVLQMPALTTLLFHNIGHDNGRPTINSSVEKLKSALPIFDLVFGAPATGSLKLVVRPPDSEKLSLLLSFRDGARAEQLFLVNLPYKRQEMPILDFLPQVLQCLSEAQIAENVQELHCEYITGNPIDSAYWKIMFAPFDNVKKLVFTDPFDHASRSLDVLAYAGQYDSLYMPRLRQIIAHSRIELDDVRLLAGKLRSLVRRRAEQGGPSCECRIGVEIELDEHLDGPESADGDAKTDRSALRERQLEAVAEAAGASMADWSPGHDEWNWTIKLPH